MDMFNISSLNEYVVNVYFTTNLFKENFTRNILGPLGVFTNVLETATEKLCGFYAYFESADETSTGYLLHNEFSFKEFIQLLDDANLAAYLNKQCNEYLTSNNMSVILKCMNIFKKELLMTTRIAIELYNAIDKCFSYVHRMPFIQSNQ
jgi:hypothetical protein